MSAVERKEEKKKEYLMKYEGDYYCTECQRFVEVEGSGDLRYAEDNIFYNGEKMVVEKCDVAKCIECGTQRTINPFFSYHDCIIVREEKGRVSVMTRESEIIIYAEEELIKEIKAKKGYISNIIHATDQVAVWSEGKRMEGIKAVYFLEYVKEKNMKTKVLVDIEKGRKYGIIKEKGETFVVRKGEKKKINGQSFLQTNPYKDVEGLPKEIQEKVMDW